MAPRLYIPFLGFLITSIIDWETSLICKGLNKISSNKVIFSSLINELKSQSVKDNLLLLLLFAR